MPRFSDRTIALVRRNVDAMLTDTCTIERLTGTKGTMGEPLDVWETVAADVRCRVIRARVVSPGTTQTVGSQESMVDTYRLVCPHGTALAVDNRVQLSDDSVYHVVSVEDGLTDEGFAGAVITRVRV